ncbi:MAG TPA: N,N-dimethylformamidase beta subunit family domain-containing protein, partial [Ktedonobacteraceae bacterium]|nr:N,N-dimethylformamidase beta subunit family domain-containing protein [Ktedonobacteraceae bacterium]
MREKVRRALRNRLALVLIGSLLAAILSTGLSYAAIHNPFFALSSAHADGPNPIQVENSKPGTPGWNDFSADTAPDTLSGFGSQISVNHGGSIDFYVTTTAPSFTIDIYRTGYYGGVGARLITSLGSFTGLHQAIPAPDPVTGLISCAGWTKTTSLTIPSTWVTGVYLAKLTSSTGHSSFIFFVVRDDGGTEDLLFQTSVTTYQAYNTWGGLSLYNNDLTDKTVYPYPHAMKVSFDRPFNPGDSNGAGHYFFFEFYFVYWMESQGYNVAYTTNVDTEARPAEILKHKGFLSVGHDEYWSMGMRNAVQNAINAGVNVAFFSANTSYWQIRFEPNSLGVPDRVVVGYKDYATYGAAPGPDPMWNVNNSLVTTLWRDPVVNMPENAMIGVMYEQQEDNNYAYVVSNAANWIYAGTGFVDGTSIPGIVGYEYDKAWNNGFAPANEIVLSNSPVHGCCGGFSSFSNSTLYTAASGARVFAAGTIQWSWGLASIQSNPYMNAGIQRTTANILNNFIGSTSAPTSRLTFSSDFLSFGNQGVHTTSAAQTVKITNSGTSALSISNIAATGTNAGDFAQTNTCPASLAAQASCTISVTFTPTASGGRSGTITLTDSDAGSPQVIALNGIGIASGSAVRLSTSNVSFGNQIVGTTSSTQTVTVTNSGVAALSLSLIQVEGLNANDFAQTNNCPASLAVNASCTITVTFTPATGGTRAGRITLNDNASDNPQYIVLSGTGVTASAGISLNPLNIDFGNQDEDEVSSAQTITLTNTGSSALTISQVAITGTDASDFAQTNNCPTSLAAGANCAISVTFSPVETGSRSAQVAISDNLAGSPHTVTLNGTGVEETPGVTLNPVMVTFADQTTGTTSSAHTITLT